MSDTAAQTTDQETAGLKDVSLQIRPVQTALDYATLGGLIFSLILIAVAIYIGQSNANFFNVPSVLMVVLGTITVTMVSYTMEEMSMTGQILSKAMFRKLHNPQRLATELMDIAVIAKKKGILTITSFEDELRKDPFLLRASQYVTDGYTSHDVENLLSQEIDMLADRHRRSAGILRRAADVAPAMGLIGTLVGLVQMLADLDNPSSIGPAMAVALLTTFYGAIMGTVVIAPLAGKLENNSNNETLSKSLIMTAMSAIARQENPRRLEMLLNSELPPNHRIRYFD
ncbi:MAG: MotA/TolQ/ExbB proton channel family protein [Rhodospirillales bacterium]|nr:MotA/TolQ/ExbB proton channel family protein [Rhodospirillales bacterium]MCB9965183.1 MotA/TolQ/ExbB proton channel family protein [Rhodospirillales bacterium]MCB9973202.1 MotA/TolQ/ExbB proton channel family protein [Rhodospirillales bacterium]MCB9979538.1 MotA/TolQ/ExbB proton channel family protein [Rhodospirillales bacterium]